MAAVVTTTVLLDTARTLFAGLRRGDGDRAAAVRALLEATTDDERTTVIEQWGSALVRRGLRVAALSMKDDEDANVFWALRDSVDEDGWTDFDTDDEDDVNEDAIQTGSNMLSEGVDEDEVADYLVSVMVA